MRLMTIFELAARSETELRVLFRQATQDAANAKLTSAERQAALATIANIARHKGWKPTR